MFFFGHLSRKKEMEKKIEVREPYICFGQDLKLRFRGLCASRDKLVQAACMRHQWWRFQA